VNLKTRSPPSLCRGASNNIKISDQIANTCKQSERKLYRNHMARRSRFWSLLNMAVLLYTSALIPLVAGQNGNKTTSGQNDDNIEVNIGISDILIVPQPSARWIRSFTSPSIALPSTRFVASSRRTTLQLRPTLRRSASASFLPMRALL
jgi:hypothetical protein